MYTPSFLVTGYYSVSESITVPDLELPMTAVRYLASELTIIEFTVMSPQFEKLSGITGNQ